MLRQDVGGAQPSAMAHGRELPFGQGSEIAPLRSLDYVTVIIRSGCGILMPNALAVWSLMNSSNTRVHFGSVR
jgi:hypothetical protein